MKREEAIDTLSSEKEAYILNIDGKPTICYSAKHIQALEMAIEALQTESCEDCISRQAVLIEIEKVCFGKDFVKFRIDNGSNGTRDYIIKYVENMPSIQPTQRTGKWEIHFILNERYLPKFTQICICKRCGGKLYRYEGQDISFCPSCGAKMKEGE